MDLSRVIYWGLHLIKKFQYLSIIPHVTDNSDHMKTHIDAAEGVVLLSLRQPADAEVAVTQQLDADTFIFL